MPVAMPPSSKRARNALRWLLAVCLVLVTHGSLYPWTFVQPGSLWSAWSAMWHQDSWWTSLGDVVGNVVLFVPVGLLGVCVQDRTRAFAPRRVVFLFVWSMLFATALQVLQIWIPSRSAAVSDAVWNLVGLLMGVTVAAGARTSIEQVLEGKVSSSAAALMLATLWLAIEWWPFLPTIDWQHVKNALKPLLMTPRWSWYSFAEVSLGLGLMMNLLRDHRSRTSFVLAMVALAILGKLFINGQSLSVSHSLGWLAGLALGGVLWRLSAPKAAMTSLGTALAWFTFDELRPFVPTDMAGSFTWVPFVASLKGSMVSNTLALCWNAFWLGAVMACARTLGANLGGLAVTLGLWTLLLEGAQVWLPDRVADITPALFPALWWLMLKVVAPAPARTAR